MTILVNRLLREHGMSRRELGRRTHLSSSMVTQRMKGRAAWAFDDLFTVAEAFGVPPEWVANELERLSAEADQVD